MRSRTAPRCLGSQHASKPSPTYFRSNGAKDSRSRRRNAQQESIIDVVSSQIVNCTAGVDGGGISAQLQSAIDVVDSRIEHCSAEFGGGANTFGRFALNSSQIVDCTARDDGGGINAQPQSILEVVDSRIEDCFAVDSGGGVITLGRFSLNFSEIVCCTAGDDGGGVFGDVQTTIDIVDSRIENCSAVDQGGGLRAFDGSNITLSSTVIFRNTALYGAGMNVSQRTQSSGALASSLEIPPTKTVAQFMQEALFSHTGRALKRTKQADAAAQFLRWVTLKGFLISLSRAPNAAGYGLSWISRLVLTSAIQSP